MVSAEHAVLILYKAPGSSCHSEPNVKLLYLLVLARAWGRALARVRALQLAMVSVREREMMLVMVSVRVWGRQLEMVLVGQRVKAQARLWRGHMGQGS